MADSISQDDFNSPKSRKRKSKFKAKPHVPNTIKEDAQTCLTDTMDDVSCKLDELMHDLDNIKDWMQSKWNANDDKIQSIEALLKKNQTKEPIKCPQVNKRDNIFIKEIPKSPQSSESSAWSFITSSEEEEENNRSKFR